jgi:hypothetical protein
MNKRILVSAVLVALILLSTTASASSGTSASFGPVAVPGTMTGGRMSADRTQPVSGALMGGRYPGCRAKDGCRRLLLQGFSALHAKVRNNRPPSLPCKVQDPKGRSTQTLWVLRPYESSLRSQLFQSGGEFLFGLVCSRAGLSGASALRRCTPAHLCCFAPNWRWRMWSNARLSQSPAGSRRPAACAPAGLCSARRGSTLSPKPGLVRSLYKFADRENGDKFMSASWR